MTNASYSHRSNLRPANGRNDKQSDRKFFQKLPEVEAIKQAIYSSGRLKEFCETFLPNGTDKLDGGTFWRVGDHCNTAGRSFTMRLKGNCIGLGYDWATDQKYDIIDCMMASRQWTKAEALAVARHRLAMPVEEIMVMKKQEITQDDIEREEKKRLSSIAAARKIWEQTEDIIGTDGESYLSRRGLDQVPPITFRFHPNHEYWDYDSTGKAVVVGKFPTIVCMVQRADDSFCGIQRIYLSPGGTGKAPVRAPKKARGDILGGAIRCADDEDIREGRVGIVEGPENALSIPHLYDGLPCWSAVSASGVAAIDLPSWVTHPVFFPDNDAPQRKNDGTLTLNADGKPIYPGLDAATAAAHRLRLEGRFPTIRKLRGGKDANAILMAENGLVL